MYLCMCKGIPVSEVVETARKNPMPLDTLVDSLGLGEDDSCGRCAIYKHEITRIIAMELKKPNTHAAGEHASMRGGGLSAQAEPASKTLKWPWMRRHSDAA